MTFALPSASLSYAPAIMKRMIQQTLTVTNVMVMGPTQIGTTNGR